MRQKVPDPRVSIIGVHWRGRFTVDRGGLGSFTEEVGCQRRGWFINKHSEGQVLESDYIPSDRKHRLLPFLFPYIPPPPSLLPSSFLHFLFISHPTPLTFL